MIFLGIYFMNTQFAVCCYNNESTVFFGSIFYKVSVVGNNTYSKNTKMGARIQRTVALRMQLRLYKVK